MKLYVIFFVAITAVSNFAWAKPKILAELGQTSPVPFVVEYMDAINQSIDVSLAISQGVFQVMPGDAFDYPVVSEAMSPGALVDRNVKVTMFSQPMAFIGDDSLSSRWLEQNYGYLRSQNIPLFLVDLDSETAFKSMKARFGDLTFYPLDANELASLAGLSTYPILVTSEGVFQ